MDTNWHSRYNEMKRRHGLTNDDVAKITKLTESNVRSQVTRADNGVNGQRRFPPWLKLAIVLDERWFKKI
ncbi:sigma-70 region 4 domain-containing protein [Nostocales cyanobacterium LEGE 12452]|nr:sigma-70 region 4 domain-containing protein [Nostocales cyanobacterium LEGE 12452]